MILQISQTILGETVTATARLLAAQKKSGRLLFSVLVTGITVAATAAVVGYTANTRTAFVTNGDRWMVAPVRRQASVGALFVHKKLMQVRTSRSGAPVLRFVECTHYPKDHKKLIQTGITTSGIPILRFVPGDYCISAGGEVAAPNTVIVEIHPESVVNRGAPVDGVVAPSFRRDVQPGMFGRALTYYQQYTCEKFGSACRVALAIQVAENSTGACEAYHYNSNGTLDWGYFQINTVHVTRRGVNLRDLLDCKANIDFAYHLYREVGFGPWSTYTSGKYRKFLDDSRPRFPANSKPRYAPGHLLIAGIDPS